MGTHNDINQSMHMLENNHDLATIGENDINWPIQPRSSTAKATRRRSNVQNTLHVGGDCFEERITYTKQTLLQNTTVDLKLCK